MFVKIPHRHQVCSRQGGRVCRLCGRPGMLDVTASAIHEAIRFAPDPATQPHRQGQFELPSGSPLAG